MENEKLKSRVEHLLSDRNALERVVEADFRNVLLRRKSTTFFDSLYEVSYDSNSLAQRPFLNVGPGSFRHKYWQTADKFYEGGSWTKTRRGVEQHPIDHEWDIYDRRSLSVAANSLHAVYCSHVIEHAFDEDVRFLFSDVKRLLRDGGVFRIVCPDADLLARAYAERDWSYFYHYLSVKTNRRRLNFDDVEKLEKDGFFAEFVLEWVSLLNNKANPIVCKGTQATHFLTQFPSLFDAFTAASALSSREVNKMIGGHVNWFNFGKASALLKSAGFKVVQRSSYLQSCLPILRDQNNFDKTDPEMSLYIDAIA